jgi:uncharacterized protein (TIGR03435 family)
MLQSTLKERFGLAGHFDKKPMQGCELVVATNGPHLKQPVTPAARSAPAAEARGGRRSSCGGTAQAWHG